MNKKAIQNDLFWIAFWYGYRARSVLHGNMGLVANENFDTSPLRCVRIIKMQGAEDEGDNSLLP